MQASAEAAGSCAWAYEAVGEVPMMVSGAGHDALAMAEVTPVSWAQFFVVLGLFKLLA